MCVVARLGAPMGCCQSSDDKPTGPNAGAFHLQEVRSPNASMQRDEPCTRVTWERLLTPLASPARVWQVHQNPNEGDGKPAEKGKVSIARRMSNSAYTMFRQPELHQNPNEGDGKPAEKGKVKPFVPAAAPAAAYTMFKQPEVHMNPNEGDGKPAEKGVVKPYVPEPAPEAAPMLRMPSIHMNPNEGSSPTKEIVQSI